MEHSHMLNFGTMVTARPALARELPNASVDVELPELQENIPPQQNRSAVRHSFLRSAMAIPAGASRTRCKFTLSTLPRVRDIRTLPTRLLAWV